MARKEPTGKDGGYTAYTMLPGKGLTRLADNTGLVADIDIPAVPVVPAGSGIGTQPIEFMPFGQNNNAFYEVMQRICDNVTVGATIEHRSRVIMGDGVQVYRKRRDAQGRAVAQEVLESEAPEVFDWLAMNDYEGVRRSIAGDLNIFNEAYVEYIFDRRTDSPKIVRVRGREATCSRISKLNPATGRSEWHGYSAEWHKGTPTDLIATPLLDRQCALRDLLQRTGRTEGDDGTTRDEGVRRYVHNLHIATPGRFYYSKPYWWSVFASGWYDFSAAIPVYKRSLIRNQMTLRYVVYINEDFWPKLYASANVTRPDDKTALKSSFLHQLEDFLGGEENAGKSFVSSFGYDKIKGYEKKDILIETLKNEQLGGEYIEDSEETSNTICYAMGIHPSIIGASPGKSKSINGTEARELFIMEQALLRSYQRLTVQPLYVAKRVNGWPQDLEFAVINSQLTTLDRGTGAVKSIGMPTETGDKGQ